MIKCEFLANRWGSCLGEKVKRNPDKTLEWIIPSKAREKKIFNEDLTIGGSRTVCTAVSEFGDLNVESQKDCDCFVPEELDPNGKGLLFCPWKHLRPNR